MIYKWLVQLMVCVHWFNSFVYQMSREIGRTCALSCDEAVIKPLDLQGRQAYGDTLVNTMEIGESYRDTFASVTLGESGERLKVLCLLYMSCHFVSPFVLIFVLSPRLFERT